MGKKKSQKSQPAVPAPKAPETKPKIPVAPAPKPASKPAASKPTAQAAPTPKPPASKPEVPAPAPAQAKPPPFKKANIPRAVREQIWLRQFGKVYEGKCPTPWCQNVITVHDFQSGHNIPESKGGPTTAENLLPLCGRCNQSMGNHYTFDEWCLLGKEPAQAPVPAKSASPAQPILAPKKPWYCWCFKI